MIPADIAIALAAAFGSEWGHVTHSDDYRHRFASFLSTFGFVYMAGHLLHTAGYAILLVLLFLSQAMEGSEWYKQAKARVEQRRRLDRIRGGR